jgi:hypothetical protein
MTSEHPQTHSHAVYAVPPKSGSGSSSSSRAFAIDYCSKASTPAVVLENVKEMAEPEHEPNSVKLLYNPIMTNLLCTSDYRHS